MAAFTVDTTDVLDLWDRAGGMAPLDRIRVLATAGDPSLSGASIDAVPLGRLHAALLKLRAALAGPVLDATTRCPDCAEVVEFSADIPALLGASGTAPDVPALDSGGWHVVWHAPTHADLAAAADGTSPGAAERLLLGRCVESAVSPGGAAVEPADLPGELRAALAAAVAAADPLAEVLVDLTCPACGAPFRSEVSVAEFVWTELDARARRVLLDVHALAQAYGWTEQTVLALGERRRAAYLRVITAGTP